MDADMRSSFHRFRVSRPSDPDPAHAAAEQSETSARTRSRSPGGGDHGGRPRSGPTMSSSSSSSAPSRHHRSLPACDRCRKFKKKCSRTLPVCSLCASANQKCSFSTPLTSTAQASQLRARVQWLEQYIADKIPGGLQDPGVTEDAEHDDLESSPNNRAGNHHDGGSQESGTSHDRNIQNSVDVRMGSSIDGASESRVPLVSDPGSVGSSSIPPSSQTGLPPDAAARRFVDAYLRNVNRAYPFVDHRKLQDNLEHLDDLSRYRRTSDSTLLYLVMAIGCTTLQRAGQIPGDSASRFHVSYSDIIQECVCSQSVESIQILMLLALYSLFDPLAPSAFTIMGIVARQAMVLGLTRRATDEKGLTASDVELRHRLTWSIFVLDRMMCTSLGLPPALLDENMNTPLPGLTIEEFASPDRGQLTMILQTSRHVVQLRQLEGRIMEEVHFKRPSVTIMLSHSDRRVIMQQIRTDIENWYSNGCLVSPTEPDNVPIHNSMTWLTARYYYLLILLYYPCQFNPAGLIIAQAELIRYCQKHLQSTAALFHHRQLPLNTVTLYRLLPVVMLMMHIFLNSPAECMPFPEEETLTVVAILEAFPEVWTLAHQAAQITARFLDSVRAISNYTSSMPHYSSQHPHSNPSMMNTVGTPSRETFLNVIRPHATAFMSLMQDNLGRASCWLLNVEDDKGVIDPIVTHIAASATSGTESVSNSGIPSSVGGTQPGATADFRYADPQQQQGLVPAGQTGNGVLGPMADTNLEWGLEMDFL